MNKWTIESAISWRVNRRKDGYGEVHLVRGQWVLTGDGGTSDELALLAWGHLSGP
jgi:hypothetical protein